MLVLLACPKRTKSSRAKVRFGSAEPLRWVCLRHGTAPCYLEAIALNTATGSFPKLTFAQQSVDNG
ncbi:hypothetical protein AWB84_08110 [Riemerella anatipestifer]|nr:hypothetical protein AWB84_08110 [Riemerella anatipestifer]